MLYPKSTEKELSPELFANPGSEYRCTPFWAWNCRLDPHELTRQIDILQQMGMGGFHMHSRSGMASPYLGEEFMDAVKACVEKARQNGMLAWLYDEDRWPSGAAGGYVTRDHAYRGRYLLFTTVPYGKGIRNADIDSRAQGERRENGRLLAMYDVCLAEDGSLASYRRIEDPAQAQSVCWYAYVEYLGDSPWYNNQAYLDTLSRAAVERFLQETHERYLEAVGKDFGGVIPAIFTDEPQFTRKQSLGFADAREDVTLPWTEDFPQTYQETYGTDILNALPELFWELGGGRISTTRYHYHDHVAERFASAFADTIGAWCDAHQLMLTGHMMEEPTLESQTAALGDAMRSLRAFGLPGIDMLCDNREYTTAKQAQSVSHQYGRPGVLSELYGVTNWDFDFRGHKLQGDWQAALGVTVRVPHLSWVSMAGEAKRDYPASINYQSPWWKEYRYVEDHFARVNTALTRGKPHIRLGVIHPVESYWLYWGPSEQTHDIREELDQHFLDLSRWLVKGLMDYHYICESLLPAQCGQGGAPLAVGAMAYDTLLVPDCVTLRGTTMDRLEAFVDAGGTLIFAGRIPLYVDAMPSDRPAKLAARCLQVGFSETEILSALQPLREVDIRTPQGIRTQDLAYQMRDDGESRWLFLAHCTKPANPDICPPQPRRIRIRGNWRVTVYNTLLGTASPAYAVMEKGWTVLETTLYAHDSLLLRLDPAADSEITRQSAATPSLSFRELVQGMVPVTLSEPNVLLLDMAEYALDEEDYRPRKEILRIDAEIRERLGYPARDGGLPQPWVVPEDTEYAHHICLRFTLESAVPVENPHLALEAAPLCGIVLDGKEIPATVDGWYTDKSIQTVPLPSFPAGRHVLELRVPIGQRLGAGWCYLLGDFGVEVLGDTARIIAPVRRLAFGDWTRQGLPFYGGNVTYHVQTSLPANSVLECAHFRNPVITVDLDGQRAGVIAYAPYRLALQAAPGLHDLAITAYGNRVNTFGCVHNCDLTMTWFGPQAWRTEGLAYSSVYRIWPTGILVSPRLGE